MQITRRTRNTVSTAATLTALGLGTALPQAAHAQTSVVAPNAYATAPGTSYAGSAPFNDASRYQQIYAASQFAGVAGPQYITQIAFRPSSTQQTSSFTQNFSNIRFDLSTTSETVSQLSATFTTNVGANDTVVFTGPLTVSSANTTTGTTKAFDILVNLTTPFLYNPAAGNLVLDIRDASTAFTPFYVDLAVDNTATPATRLNFVDNTTSTTGTVQPGGLVTRFAFTPAPEPSQTAALGLGVLGLSGLVLKARKRQSA